MFKQRILGTYLFTKAAFDAAFPGTNPSKGDADRHIKDAEIAFEMAMADFHLHRGMAAVYSLSKQRKPRRRTRELYEAVWAELAKPKSDDV